MKLVKFYALAGLIFALASCNNDVGSTPPPSTTATTNAVASLSVAIHTETSLSPDYSHKFSFVIKSTDGTIFPNSIENCSANFCNLATNLPFHNGKKNRNLYSITAYDNGGYIGFGGIAAISSQQYVAIDPLASDMYLQEHPETSPLGPIATTNNNMSLDMTMSSTACSIIQTGSKVLGQIGNFSATAKGISAGVNIFGDVFGSIFSPCKSNFNSTVLTDLNSIMVGESQIESQLDSISQQLTLIAQQDQLITTMLVNLTSSLNSANAITDQLIYSQDKVQLQTYSAALAQDEATINSIAPVITNQCSNVAGIANFDLESNTQLAQCLENSNARINIEKQLLYPQQLNGCLSSGGNCVISNLSKISPMLVDTDAKTAAGDLQTVLYSNYLYIGTNLLTMGSYPSVWVESGPYALSNYDNSLAMLNLKKTLLNYNAYQQLGGYILLKYPQDPLTAQYANPGDTPDQVALNFAASFYPIEEGTESSVYQYYSTNHGGNVNYYKVASDLEADLGGAIPITKQGNASQCQMTDYNNSVSNPTVYYQCDNSGNDHLPLYLKNCANNNPISSPIGGNTINTNVYYSNSGTGGYLVCDDTYVGTSVGQTMGSSGKASMFNVEYPHPQCSDSGDNYLVCNEASVVDGSTINYISHITGLLTQTPGNSGVLNYSNGILTDNNSTTQSFTGLLQLDNGGVVDYVHNYLGSNSGSMKTKLYTITGGSGNSAELWLRCPLGNISGCRNGNFNSINIVWNTSDSNDPNLNKNESAVMVIPGTGGAILKSSLYNTDQLVVQDGSNQKAEFTQFFPSSSDQNVNAGNVIVQGNVPSVGIDSIDEFSDACAAYSGSDSQINNETCSASNLQYNLTAISPLSNNFFYQMPKPMVVYSYLNGNLDNSTNQTNHIYSQSGDEFGNIVMTPGFTLYPNQAVRTYVNGGNNNAADVYQLYLSDSGDLQEYQCSDINCSSGFLIWHTATSGALKAAMQSDGNFVLYNSSNQGIWGTNTYAGGTNTSYNSGGSAIPAPTPAGNHLVLQIDGNLVVYQNPQDGPDPLLDNGTAVWNNQMSVTNLNNSSSYANGWQAPQGYGS